MVKASGINVPFILVTATMSEEFAVPVIQQGADEYILKNNWQEGLNC
jgi:DNA-binding response OmpR family regulator